MAVVQLDSKIPTCEPGQDEIIIRIDLAAGADSSQAVVFFKPFASKPMVRSIVRDDDTAIDVACTPSTTGVSATGFTLRQKGTSTVIQTYNVTICGNYINPTVYLRS